ncbi:hypothetical protein [Vibrio cidicii]
MPRTSKPRRLTAHFDKNHQVIRDKGERIAQAIAWVLDGNVLK